MNQPLEQRVDQVARQAVRLRRVEAVCRLLAAAIVIVILACTFDWFVRSQLFAVRWLVSLAALAAIVFTAWSWVWPALRWRLSRLTAARRIEARFPQLRDRLTSAVAFSGQTTADRYAGSPELRRMLIAETTTAARELSFAEALDRRPLRAALLIATATFIGLGVLIAIKPFSARIALQRLAMPTSNVRWPLRHALAVVDTPTMIAAGDDFELHVIDRQGSLPDDARLFVRFTQANGPRIETPELKLLGQQLVYRSNNVDQSFEYRVVGGDDHTMPWATVEVVEPPRLTNLSLTVTPPSYSGLPVEQAQRIARILAGSQLAAVGELDKPAVAVKLQSDAKPAPDVEIQLAADGRSFRIGGAGGPSWQPERSGSYWFDLQDASGVVGGRDHALELQVVPDEPPTIAWEQPTDGAFVTPNALAPIRAFVKDDLRVQRVQLQFLREDTGGAEEQVQALYPAADLAKAKAGEGQAVAIDAPWDLAKLSELQIGDVLTVRLAAFDAKLQSTTTAVRRLTIVSPVEFEQRIEQQQSSVFTQLAEALRLQRDAHNVAEAFATHIAEAPQLIPQDVDQLQAAELAQRQVNRLLSDPHEGAADRLKSLLAQLRDNRIENSSLPQRLTTLLTQVNQLNDEQLPLITQQLLTSLKQVRSELNAGNDSATAASLAPSLAIAQTQQQQVISTLEAMIDELSEWDNISRLSREVSQLREQQTVAEKETESLRWKIAMAPGQQLTSDQRAASRQIAVKQQDLARRFDKTHARFEQMTARRNDSDPVAAARLAEAAATSRRLAIGANMRQAGRELTEYRAGAAQQTQRGVLQALGELLDTLASRRDRNLSQANQALQAAAEQLDELSRRQQGLAEQFTEEVAAPAGNELQQRLEGLALEELGVAEKGTLLAKQLQRLQAEKAAESTANGAAAVTQATASARAGDAAVAEQQAAAAARLLSAAHEQLTQRLQRGERDLSRELQSQREQAIASLLERQQAVVAEAKRLEETRDENRQLSDDGQMSLATVVAQQRQLAEETNQLGAELAEYPALQFSLTGAGRDMQRSVATLEAGGTDERARRPAESAVARLEQLLQALREPATDEPSAPQSDPDNPNSDNNGKSQSLAELRLLAAMQNEINRRTVELERQREQSGAATADDAAALANLAQEQGELASIVQRFLSEEEPAVSQEFRIISPNLQPTRQEVDPQPSSDLDDPLLRDLLEKQE